MKIKNINKDDLQELVTNSLSLAEIFRKLQLHKTGGNYRLIKKRLIEENINYSHITLGLKNRLGKKNIYNESIIKNLLTINSICKSNNHLKHLLLDNGFLKNECYICNITNVWNKLPLSLQMDHINGINTDNRIENLRILCPNCHSQTTTYSAKNKTKKQNAKCPTKQELEKLLLQKPICYIAKDFKASCRTINKWINNYNLTKMPAEYWIDKTY